LAIGGLVLVTVAACGGSSDEVCEQACEAWDRCELDLVQPDDCDVIGWPYARCFETCKDDGDWDQDYADCVDRQTTCCEMEQGCG
jgi:hypothetical protein